MSRLILCGLLTLTPLALAQPVTPVRTGTVEQRELQKHERVTGTLRAASRAVIAAREAGPVLEVLVDEGDVIAAGDVLAHLDTRRLDATLRRHEADLAVARATVVQRRALLEDAEQDRSSLAEAADTNAVSKRELRRARTAEAVAAALLSAAEKFIGALESQIELAKIRIDDATVRAPFAARVVERTAEPGEWLDAGEPVVTIISTGMIEAWLEVPERFTLAVGVHADEVAVDVRATSDSRRSLRTRVVPMIHPRARTFSLIAHLANDDGRLLPGMSVTAWLPIGEKSEYLTVPKDALVRRGSAHHVYRVTRAGVGFIAQMLPVGVLFETADVAVLRTPVELASGDRVIVEGNERLQPGMPIALEPEESAEAAAKGTGLAAPPAGDPASGGSASGGTASD